MYLFDFDKDELQEAVEKCKSYRGLCRHFNTPYDGRFISKLKKLLASHYISTEHFTGFQQKIAKDLSEILTENSSYGRGHLKRRLLKDGLLKNFCSICNMPPKWNGKLLVLRLDHKNGVRNDNRIENLRLVCPNCDSQTEFFAGRNKKWPLRNVNCRKCKKDFTLRPRSASTICDLCRAGRGNKSNRRNCLVCKLECNGKEDKFCSPECYHASTKGVIKMECRKVLRPCSDQLAQDIATMPYLQIGKKYGVSDNAVRKWAKQYGLSTKSKTRKLVK